MNEYIVELELAVVASAEYGLALVEAFVNFDGVAGVSEHGNADLQACISAETLADASRLAFEAAVSVGAGEPIVLVVTEAKEWDHRQGIVNDEFEDVMSVSEVAARLGVSRQRVHQLVGEGRIPVRRVGHSIIIAEKAVKAFELGKKLRSATEEQVYEVV